MNPRRSSRRSSLPSAFREEGSPAARPVREVKVRRRLGWSLTCRFPGSTPWSRMWCPATSSPQPLPAVKAMQGKIDAGQRPQGGRPSRGGRSAAWCSPIVAQASWGPVRPSGRRPVEYYEAGPSAASCISRLFLYKATRKLSTGPATPGPTCAPPGALVLFGGPTRRTSLRPGPA